MKRSEVLNKKLLRLKAKAEKLDSRAAEATDAAEIEMLTEQRSEVGEEISETEAELEALADEEKQERQAPPANAEVHNAGVLASFGTPTEQRKDECILESMEYRKAFMSYVQRGTPIPAEMQARVDEYKRANPAQYRSETINTGNTGAVIPLTVMREVINTNRKRYGNLYDRVTKMSIPGGVEFPIGDLDADFKWITESTVSDNQDIGAVGKVSFAYHVAEIRIAQSFLSYVLSIEDFESKIVEVIALAYRRAMDKGIVKGTGNGQMLGLINDARITQNVTMTAAQINNWAAWRKNFFAKLPLGYRSGEFIFPVSTVDSYLETMADANNNPVYRQATGLEVNDGDAADPNGRFFGRRISLVETDILPDFDTANSNDVIGIYWDPTAYAVNENFGFTVRKYFDEINNKWIDKALVVVDGKVLNPKTVWLIKKG